MRYNEEDPNIVLAQSLELHQQPFSTMTNMQKLHTQHSKDTLAQEQPSIMVSQRPVCQTAYKQQRGLNSRGVFECRAKM